MAQKLSVATKRRISSCTNFWHPPVDELHSIENEPLIDSKILLTSLAAGVKTHSFFDKFRALQLMVCHFKNARERVAKTPATS